MSFGFTTASAPSPGILCIPFPPGVSTNLPLEISDNGNETDQWNQSSNGQCGGTGFEIANITGGTGTGLSGGAIPREGGIVIAFARMNRILEIDLENERAVVEPGLVNLNQAEIKSGLSEGDIVATHATMENRPLTDGLLVTPAQ